LALALAVLALGLGAARADWPNFRGANHDGISDEKGFKTTWTGPLPLVWERDLGSAFSSFACVGDKVYTCGTRSGKQVIYCLNADTGKTVWQERIEEEYPERQGGDGPRATPTVDDGRVYILGARGTLLCLDAYTGKKIWNASFTHMPEWGYSGSVLIEGDLAIATGGKSDGALAAFDKKTGKPAWRSGDDIAGYATPYPFTFEGVRYIAGFTGTSAIIAEAETGRLVWRKPWRTDWRVNAASPIFDNGYLFLGSGYSTGCALHKLRKSGDDIEADEIWKSRILRSKFQSPILYDGKLYASDQRALICVDFLTGDRHWHKLKIKHGTLVLADGHLLLLTENGQLQIAKVDPTGFEPLTTADILSGRCWTVSALHRGKLYARNLTRAVCFDLQ
jgi:outer membrane protein assembly factor BamB